MLVLFGSLQFSLQELFYFWYIMLASVMMVMKFILSFAFSLFYIIFYFSWNFLMGCFLVLTLNHCWLGLLIHCSIFESNVNIFEIAARIAGIHARTWFSNWWSNNGYRWVGQSELLFQSPSLDKCTLMVSLYSKTTYLEKVLW